MGLDRLGDESRTSVSIMLKENVSKACEKSNNNL